MAQPAVESEGKFCQSHKGNALSVVNWSFVAICIHTCRAQMKVALILPHMCSQSHEYDYGRRLHTHLLI